MVKQLTNYLEQKYLSERKKEEIQTFTDLWAYQELMSRPYFVYLKQKISRQLGQYHFKNKNILEIGAGTSQFLKLFEDRNQVVALDISAELLKQNLTKAKLVVADAEHLPFADKSFDFIYAIGVLHHLEDQKKALSEIKRVLKSNGQVFLSEPTKWSLNLPYYLLRRLAIVVLGEKRYRDLSGCGSPKESFVSIKAVKEIFGIGFQLKFTKILPLRMPPIKLFEALFSRNINDILEKIPLINNLGTIVWIRAKKIRKGKMNPGFGTEYEKYILRKIATKICQKYKIKSCLEFPKNRLLSERGIFLRSKRTEKPDLVWNFCEFENQNDSEKFLEKISSLSKKYLLIITQNHFNPGVFLHLLYHQVSGRKWDHGDFRKMSYFSVLKTAKKNKNLKVVEINAFDIPWFILDVYETGKYFRRLPIIKRGIKKIKESRLENYPRTLKLILGHHHYLLLEKQRG